MARYDLPSRRARYYYHKTVHTGGEVDDVFDKMANVVSKFQAWNFESTENPAKIKKGSVDEEDRFNKEVDENFTVYCTPLIPCIKELRKVVFPEGKQWFKEDRQLYSRIKSVLQQARKDLDTIEQ
ncbi:MAG: hypothetical protein M1840_008126 [Geoglossum simile]|nr:MAG: hypothetical protein M1840_008126 [Geoglossum simile]